MQLDLENTKASGLAWMPGANGLVSFDGHPADVPEGLIRAIRRRVNEINAAGGELMESLKSGDSVTIQDGPFAGYQAIFDSRVSRADRVRVLLTLLKNRQVPLELSAGQIRQ